MQTRRLLMGTIAAGAMLAGPALAERGADGQLNIIYWQAPSIQNPYLSGGTKDIESSSLVLEPLANYDPAGNMLTTLAAEIPSLENGGISDDLKSITWKLKDGVVWSDGTPFTAADVVFSGEYCMHPEGGCNAASKFNDVENIEAIDDLTVKITFSVAKPFPYGPFVGGESPIIQKAQFENCMGAKAPECTEENFGPHGTGPYTVTEFKANDVVTYAMNE
ncbi:MAG: ABC transporter substrate-binding protein, partial [Pseudomonadota bacterium]